MHIARSPAATCAAVICAAVICACGGSSPRGGPSAAAGPLLQLARCMRAHGEPRFPDPGGTGGLVIPTDINTRSPAFRSAQQACARFAQPTSGGGESAAARKLQLLALAKCMRAHGVSWFADPTSSPPPPSGGNAIGGNGSYLALGTAQERESPAYRRAAAACGAGIP